MKLRGFQSNELQKTLMFFTTFLLVSHSTLLFQLDTMQTQWTFSEKLNATEARRQAKRISEKEHCAVQLLLKT